VVGGVSLSDIAMLSGLHAVRVSVSIATQLAFLAKYGEYRHFSEVY
jgi:hypothetical protein